MNREDACEAWRRWLPGLALTGVLLWGGGCATPYQTAALVAGGVVAAGAKSPAQELEQIYYLGVFDPEEQLPPAVYRLTVRGQASILSNTKFASGWVPASLVDALNGRIGLDPSGSGEVEFSQTNTAHNVSLATGRRLMLFGPEGFREAPRNHRLVIVMGADPKTFFEAMDSALGQVSGVTIERQNTALEQKLFQALVSTASSRENLSRLKAAMAEDLPRQNQP
jgi:hypothetical protein